MLALYTTSYRPLEIRACYTQRGTILKCTARGGETPYLCMCGANDLDPFTEPQACILPLSDSESLHHGSCSCNKHSESGRCPLPSGQEDRRREFRCHLRRSVCSPGFRANELLFTTVSPIRLGTNLLNSQTVAIKFVRSPFHDTPARCLDVLM